MSHSQPQPSANRHRQAQTGRRASPRLPADHLTPAIEAHELHKRFGSHRVIQDLSLAVYPGSIYALVGPDGAGKTTAIRLLAGALRPDQGTVALGGHDLLRHTERAQAMLGYLPQRFSLYEDLTVMENLQFFAQVRGLQARDWTERSMEILRFVGLDDFVNLRAQALSGGMKQKLGLAAALVHRPSILLLDEPTGGVDPATRQSFWRLLIRLVGQGIAVLLSTPYMDEASRCTNVGFLYQGRLLLQGSPGEILGRFRGRIYEVIGEPINLIRSQAQSLIGPRQVQSFGDRLHIHLAAPAQEPHLQRLQQMVVSQGGQIHRMREVSPSMEDAFLALLLSENQAYRSAAERADPGRATRF